jgi:hypothetical protein
MLPLVDTVRRRVDQVDSRRVDSGEHRTQGHRDRLAGSVERNRVDCAMLLTVSGCALFSGGEKYFTFQGSFEVLGRIDLLR